MVKAKVPLVNHPAGCSITVTLQNNLSKQLTFIGNISRVTPIMLVARIATGGEATVTTANDLSGLGTPTMPSVDCGISGPISSRISDCMAQNPSTSLFSDASMPKKYEWSLVTKTSTKTLWRDNLTGLIWSDQIGGTSFYANWCRASGSNNKIGSPFLENDSMYCGNSTNQSATAPISLCAEDPTNLNGTLTSDESKGHLGKLSSATTPEVIWRLPSAQDWKLAWTHGAKKVLPNMAASYWTSSINSSNRNTAWGFDSNSGGFSSGTRDIARSIRCVGTSDSM